MLLSVVAVARWMSMRRTGLLLAVGLLLVGLGCAAAGGGPQNVVMDYLTAAQVGHVSAAQSHLCSHLRDSPTQYETATLKRLVSSESSEQGPSIARRTAPNSWH